VALHTLAYQPMNGGVWGLIPNKKNGIFHAVKIRSVANVRVKVGCTLRDALAITTKVNLER